MCDSDAAEARQASNEQEHGQQKELKKKLEKAEMLNKTYEKSLRENTGQMISVIEKMQRMVEQVMCLSVLYAFMTLYFDRFVLTYYVFIV